MITNIILGAILSVILGILLILNNKCNQIHEYQQIVKKDLDCIINYVKTNNKLLEHLENRFNDFILHYKSNNTTIKETLTKIDKGEEVIFNRINTLDTDIQNLIITENTNTRKEISKQAKISSKIKSYSKMNKSTNK